MSEKFIKEYNWKYIIPFYGIYLIYKSDSGKALLYTLNILITFLLLIVITRRIDYSTVLNNTSKFMVNAIQEEKSSESTSRELLNKLIGSWGNDRGESLEITKTHLNSKIFIPGGYINGVSSEYKLVGLEYNSDNTIRLSVGEGAIWLDALVLFRDDNTILFGYIGESCTTLNRK